MSGKKTELICRRGNTRELSYGVSTVTPTSPPSLSAFVIDSGADANIVGEKAALATLFRSAPVSSPYS